MKSLFFLALILVQLSWAESPNGVISGCFDLARNKRLNECAHSENCFKFPVSINKENEQKPLETCACNQKVNGDIDVGFVLDSTPDVKDYSSEKAWNSMVFNVKKLTNNIFGETKSRINVWRTSNSVGDNAESITKGFMSVRKFNSVNAPFVGHKCHENGKKSLPCQSKSHSCSAIKNILSEMDADGNSRKKVLVVVLNNKVIDLKKCLGSNNPFPTKRSDLTLVLVGSRHFSLEVNDMNKIGENILDNVLITSRYGDEIVSDGEKKCTETKLYKHLPSTSNFVKFSKMYTCTVWPHEDKNELMWSYKFGDEFLTVILPIISDHLCQQKASHSHNDNEAPSANPGVIEMKSERRKLQWYNGGGASYSDKRFHGAYQKQSKQWWSNEKPRKKYSYSSPMSASKSACWRRDAPHKEYRNYNSWWKN